MNGIIRMQKNLKKNQLLKIVPEDVSLACTAKVKSIRDDCITVSTDTHLKDGICECFSTTETGIIYFKSSIAKNCGYYSVKIPKNHIIIQRREYSRIPLKQNTILKGNSAQADVVIIDLSAGGAQILCNSELKMSENYEITIKLGNNISVKTMFTPIRQEKTDENNYAVSGKFKQISHKDRITLIQYCFSRLMENTNK